MSFVGSAGVIGWPVAHSKSPLIHRFWLVKLGLDGDYGRFPVAPDRLGEAIRALPALGLRGVNVTVPHKQAVIPFLDRLDPLAERVGAVNTIVVVEGKLVGYNTDVAGVAEPLLELVRERPPRPDHTATCVQIIGAGGAARAAVTGAREVGYGDFAIFNRSVEKAHELASAGGAPFGTAAALSELGPVRKAEVGPADQRCSHVVINATTLGMTGNPPVRIDLSRYDADTIVFEMVYAPLATPLLAQARKLGMRTIDGLQMLVGQAGAAFALFYGCNPPREHDAELRALLLA